VHDEGGHRSGAVFVPALGGRICLVVLLHTVFGIRAITPGSTGEMVSLSLSQRVVGTEERCPPSGPGMSSAES
jgi:hypothetical protein